MLWDLIKSRARDRVELSEELTNEGKRVETRERKGKYAEGDSSYTVSLED
jgi:hypothetical protein